MKIKPLKDQVLIKVDLAEEKSKGGLFLVSAEPVVKSSGIVMAIGDSDVIKVKIGDHVLFEKSMGRRFDLPAVGKDAVGRTWLAAEEHILVSSYDVIAILEEI